MAEGSSLRVGKIKDIHPKAAFPLFCGFLLLPISILWRGGRARGGRRGRTCPDRRAWRLLPSCTGQMGAGACLEIQPHTRPSLENPWMGLGRARWGRGKGQSRGFGEERSQRPPSARDFGTNIPRGAGGRKFPPRKFQLGISASNSHSSSPGAPSQQLLPNFCGLLFLL